MQIAENISRLLGLAEAVCTIVGFLVGCCIAKAKKAHRAFVIKQLIFGGFLNREQKVFVSLPEFKGEILGKERDVIIADEVSLLLDIDEFLSGVGISIETNGDVLKRSSREVLIGGPVSNELTNRYVKCYMKNFKWVVTKDHLDRYKADKNLKLLNFDYIDISADGREGFQLGNVFYEYIPDKKGWAVIAKIIDRENRKIIHLLFGCGANGTVGAVRKFIGQYRQIYRRNKTRPYIGIFEVDRSGNAMQKHITWLKTQDFFMSAQDDE